MLALAVQARVSGKVLRGGAAVGGMFFSTMPAGSPIFACMGSVSVVIASLPLGHNAVLN